jgi:hypothetical protein
MGMRAVVIGAVIAAGLSFAGPLPTMSAPANVTVIARATADISLLTQVRCYCTLRSWRGYCRRWRCD